MNLEILNFLIDEVIKEKEVIDKRKESFEQVNSLRGDEVNYKRALEKYYRTKKGSKMKVKEYLKTIRRITLEIEREIESD